MIFQGLAIKEAIASVAIEHGAGCTCRICRAAAGDLMALAAVWTEVQDGLDEREARGESARRASARTPGSRAGEPTDDRDRTEE